MGYTIRPKAEAGPREPHPGLPHRWRAIGAHVIHVGSKRKSYKQRRAEQKERPFANSYLHALDRQEIREVFVCDAADDAAVFGPCKEVLVKIRHKNNILRWNSRKA